MLDFFKEYYHTSGNIGTYATYDPDVFIFIVISQNAASKRRDYIKIKQYILHLQMLSCNIGRQRLVCLGFFNPVGFSNIVAALVAITVH